VFAESRAGALDVVSSIDYVISAFIIDCFNTFDCEIYISNIDELEMDDDETIILPDHV
jgi:hypothetical protein